MVVLKIAMTHRWETQPFNTVAQIYSPNDVSIVFFTDVKIFTVITSRKPQNDQLCMHIHPQRRKISRQNAHNDRSVTDDISRPITSGWYYTGLTVLSITESILVRSRLSVVMWCCYNTRTSKFFILSAGQFPGAHGAWGNQLLPQLCQMLSYFNNPFKTYSAVNL